MTDYRITVTEMQKHSEDFFYDPSLNLEIWSKNKNIMIRVDYVKISEDDKERILKAVSQIIELVNTDD